MSGIRKPRAIVQGALQGLAARVGHDLPGDEPAYPALAAGGSSGGERLRQVPTPALADVAPLPPGLGLRGMRHNNSLLFVGNVIAKRSPAACYFPWGAGRPSRYL